MTITKSQRITISQIWNKVCKDRGWSASDRALRLSTFGGILGRELASMDLIGRTDECTKVMHSLNAMLGVSLKSGREATDPTLNKARNLRHVILNELTPCLALYVEDVAGYITAIMEDKNRWWKIDRPACDISLEDLDAKPVFRRLKSGELKEFPSTLEQLVFTIQARLNVKRNEAGHSIHDMKLAAGVVCGCKACCLKAHLRNNPAPILPPISAGTDEAKTTADLLNETHDENPY